MTHDLKTWPEPFAAVLSGAKTYEIRVNDRGFKVGDRLLLREWVPAAPMLGPQLHEPGYLGPHYTGRSILVEVTYLSAGGTWGLPPGMCVMSIRKVEPASEWVETWETGRVEEQRR